MQKDKDSASEFQSMFFKKHGNSIAKYFWYTVILIIPVIVSSFYKVLIKDNIVKELMQTQFYLSLAVQFNNLERPLLLGNAFLISLISAALSLGIIFLFGFWWGYVTDKKEFNEVIFYANNIKQVKNCTFIPFPEDVRRNKELPVWYKKDNRFIVEYFQDDSYKTQIILIVFIFIVMSIKDLFIVRGSHISPNIDFIAAPWNDISISFLGKSKIFLYWGNFCIDIILIAICLAYGWILGGDIFRQKYTSPRNWDRPVIIDKYISVYIPQGCFSFICPLLRLHNDEFSIEYAIKVYSSYSKAEKNNTLDEWLYGKCLENN
jgi:hypothetical protein